MASAGTWFVLFDAKKKIPFSKVVASMKTMKSVKIDAGKSSLSVTDKQGRVVSVALSRRPHVVEESKDIVENFGQDRADREKIASCAARFEILFAIGESADIFNILVGISERLEEVTGGVLFDANNGVFF